MRKSANFLILLFWLLTACTAPVATPTLLTTPTSIPLPNPTLTSSPTFTPESTAIPEPTAVPETNRIGEGGTVETWNEESGAYEKMETSIPLLDGIRLAEVRQAGDGVYEAYDTEGRLMQVNDGTGWVTAPMGMKLQDSVWYLWVTAAQTWTPEWKISDLDERIETLGTLVDEMLVHPEAFKTGEMQCAAPELCFHMQVKPEMAHQGYLMLLDAFAKAKSPELRKYFREIGFTGSTGEDLEKFLETSIGPNGETHFLPAFSPNGTEFTYVQGEQTHVGVGGFRNNNLIIRNGGVKLDWNGIAAYTSRDWQTSPWVRAWVSWMKQNNAAITSELLIGHYGYNEWGLLVHPSSGRFIFVEGHTGLWPEVDNNKLQLGGVLGQFRPDYDPELFARHFMAYFMAYSRLLNGSNIATLRICPILLPIGGCDDYVTQNDLVDLFEPQP